MAIKQPSFFIKHISKFHIGTVAVFQIDETDLLETIPAKLAGLSDTPQHIAYSRMGDNAPAKPRDKASIPRKLTRETFKVSYRERQRLEKAFIICYLEALGPDNIQRFAYVNVRGDRLEALLEAGQKDEEFDLSQKSTLVLAGAADLEDYFNKDGVLLITSNSSPTDEQKERLRRDYLFGDEQVGFTQVRIFPPLDEVTTPKKVERKFEFGFYEKFHIGCISAFGIQNEDLIESIARKLASLNEAPGPLVFSKYGTEVPAPPYEPSNIEHKSYDDIEWEFDEVSNFGKVFIIAFLSGKNSKGDKVFAYINCRADRLRGLLYKERADEYFDLVDYATTIVTGTGNPTIDETTKLQKDYLFGEQHINVRIFPPLAEIT